MTEKKELTENEKRIQGVTASDGAHVDELQVDEKDRQESVAGSVEETKAAKASTKK